MSPLALVQSYLCVECGAVVEHAPSERPSGWEMTLCPPCDAADLERATERLAASVALEPDTDIRALHRLPDHLMDAILTGRPPRQWMPLDPDDLIELEAVLKEPPK